MTRAAEALIDYAALRHNCQRVRQCAPDSRVLAVIKANGYGHGITRVARTLQQADGFAVASIDEALILRAANIDKPIVLLEGFFDVAELALIQQYRLSIVLHHIRQLEILEQTLLTQPLSVWLKIDTGMHRLGFNPAQFEDVYRRLQALPNIAAPLVLMSHLANAEDRHDELTSAQTECFHQAVKGYDGQHSLANSAAILAWPQTHFYQHPNWVRPGIMLYGASPFIDDTGAEHELHPVMTLRSRLIAINQFKAGDAIGYGGSWRCPEDMPVGVVAIGYGDGYPRSAQAGTPVLVNGRRAPLIGRVSMDMITVDLRQLGKTDIGDEVILWGQGLAVEEVARHAGTIPYELLCGVTERVRVIEVNENAYTGESSHGHKAQTNFG